MAAQAQFTVSIIIPVKPGGDVGHSTGKLQTLNYPAERIETLISEGYAPSRQRNLAVKQAKGDIIIFLDNDSEVSADYLKNVLKPFYKDERVAVVGGPNLTPDTDTLWQKAFGCCLASKFAHANMAARYRPIGPERDAGEKELILCGLAVQKQVFDELGGFNEMLYPNEENEFMNRVAEAGYRLIYKPDAIIYRSRRRTIPAFMRQMANYGRGRIEQAYSEDFHLRNMFFLAPMGFVSYCLILPLLIMIFASGIVLVPAVLYGLVGLFSAIGFSIRERLPGLAIILLPCYLIMHISYSAGMLVGLRNIRSWSKSNRQGAKPPPPRSQEVDIKRFKALDQPWKN